jgi:hypothetical protein
MKMKTKEMACIVAVLVVSLLASTASYDILVTILVIKNLT